MTTTPIAALAGHFPQLAPPPASLGPLFAKPPPPPEFARPERINPVGRVYGKLTVLEDLGGRRRAVRCRCECGKEVRILLSSAMKPGGAVASCGCARARPTRSQRKLVVTIGERFGMLVVIAEHDGPSVSHERYVECRCDCGQDATRNWYEMRKGNVTSCGCADRRKRPRRNR